jgi:hypothetical protein
MVKHTFQTWHRWGLVAGLLLALGVLAWGGEAVAYDKRPDLQTWSIYDSSGAGYVGWPYGEGVMPFNVVVYNDGDLGEWNPDSRTWDVLPLGGPAYNVVVKITLPSQLTFAGVISSGSFTCVHNSGIVTCSGNRLGNAASLTLTIAVHLPANYECFPISPLYAIGIVVDPANTIAERLENNNTGSGQVGIVCIN